MARAIWKGEIRLGDVAIAVKLYSAVVDRAVRFRLLHSRDMVPVQQRMVHPETGKTVPSEQIRKGYELDDGTFVVLEPDELASLDPPASRNIEIVSFVPESEVSHAWYDRPYHLSPDGDAAAYFALVGVLHRLGKLGVTRWVMRKKEYNGALRSTGRHLMLITMRTADEVIPAAALPAPTGRELEAKELRMAQQLVSALEDRFDPSDYRDEYRARVEELVAAKAAGATIPMPKPPRREKPRSLSDALEASLKRAHEEKGKRAA